MEGARQRVPSLTFDLEPESGQSVKRKVAGSDRTFLSPLERGQLPMDTGQCVLCACTLVNCVCVQGGLGGRRGVSVYVNLCLIFLVCMCLVLFAVFVCFINSGSH